MKSEVYSWRLSGELKSDLEREARLRKVSISTVLETAVRDLLKNGSAGLSDDETQRELHQRTARCLGVLNSGNARRSETVRQTLRRRLKRRYAR